MLSVMLLICSRRSRDVLSIAQSRAGRLQPLRFVARSGGGASEWIARGSFSEESIPSFFALKRTTFVSDGLESDARGYAQRVCSRASRGISGLDEIHGLFFGLGNTHCLYFVQTGIADGVDAYAVGVGIEVLV